MRLGAVELDRRLTDYQRLTWVRVFAQCEYSLNLKKVRTGLVDQLSLAASLTSRGALMLSNPRRLERFSRESYALSNLCALLERSNAVRGGEDSCEFARVQVGSRFNAELLEMNSVTTT